MPLVLVGDGHASPDYVTAQLAWDTLKGVDQGGDIIAECLGYCGVFATTGSALNLFHFKPASGVVFTGSNELELPTLERISLSQTSQIIIDDILVFTTNQYVSAMSLSSDTFLSNRCVFDNRTSGSNAVAINGIYPNTNINNFIARGGLDSINAGYLRGTNFNKGEVYGASGFGVNGSAGGANFQLTDVLAFNNGTDFDAANMTLNTCASEDLTGTITGYTSAELVDFANKDYRIKSTSFLATAGSGGSFIGAFLEYAAGASSDLTTTITDEASIVAGGSTITLTLTGDTFVTAGATFDAERQGLIDNLVSAQSEANGWNAEKVNLPVTDVVRTSDTVVTITLSALASYDITADEEITSTIQASALVTSASDVVSTPTFTISTIPTINVIGTTTDYNYLSIQGQIDLTSEITVIGNTYNYQYTSINGITDVTGELLIIGSLVNYLYSQNIGSIDLTGEILVSGNNYNYIYQKQNGIVSLDAEISVFGATSNYIYSKENANIGLTGEINISGNGLNYSFSSVNGIVNIGQSQLIGDFTIKYKESGISLSYKVDEISLGFKSSNIKVQYK